MHGPISFNLNDSVITSYSKKYVELLFDTIMESKNDYPTKC